MYDEKGHQAVLQAIRDYTEKNTKTPELAMRALQRSGIYDGNGELMPEYCQTELGQFSPPPSSPMPR